MNISPSTSNPVYLNVPSNMHGVVISNQSDVAVVLQTNYHEFTIPEFCAYTNECAPGDQLEFIANANATTGMVEVNFYEAHLQTSLVPTRNIIQSNVEQITTLSASTPNLTTLFSQNDYYLYNAYSNALPPLNISNYSALLILINGNGSICTVDTLLYYSQTSDGPVVWQEEYDLYVGNLVQLVVPVLYPFVTIKLGPDVSILLSNLTIVGLTNTRLNLSKAYMGLLNIGVNSSINSNSTDTTILPPYVGPAILNINLPIQTTPLSLNVIISVGNYTEGGQIFITNFNITGSTTQPVQTTLNLNFPPNVCQLVITNSNSTAVPYQLSIISS